MTHTHTFSNIHKPTHWAVRFSYWSEQGSAGLANVITECNICVWPEGYRDLAAQAWPAGCRKHRLLAVMNRLGSNGTAAQEKVESNAITEGQTEAFSCYYKSPLCENLIFPRLLHWVFFMSTALLSIYLYHAVLQPDFIPSWQTSKEKLFTVIWLQNRLSYIGR